MWREPVIDRTYMDIVMKLSKAFLNVEDMNRIEENCAYLGDLMGVDVQTRKWSTSDFPTLAECTRISDNIRKLRKKGYVHPDTPMPPIPYEYNKCESINAVEQILEDIYRAFWAAQEIRDNYTGEIYTGEEIGVI